MPVIPGKPYWVAKEQTAQFIDGTGPEFFATANPLDDISTVGDPITYTVRQGGEPDAEG